VYGLNNSSALEGNKALMVAKKKAFLPSSDLTSKEKKLLAP
jgi:hypothetical protein